MMTKKTRIAALLSSCLLAACSTYQQAQQQYKDTSVETERLNQLAAQPMDKADMSMLQEHSGVYLGALALKRQSGQTLPVRVEHEGVRLMSSAPQTLLEIGDLITEASGIPVSFAADVFAMPNPDATSTSNLTPANDSRTDELSAALDAALPHTSKVKGKNSHPSVFAGKRSNSSRERMRVNYKGSLSGFLNLTASYFDVGWSYRDGRLQFSRQITRSFQLVAMPSVLDSSSELNAGMSTEGDTEGAGVQAGSSQSAKVSVKLDFWKDLDASLKTIIGTKGDYSASRSSSSITVTGPASVVERVSKYIQDLNKQLLRQVTVRVEVYTVQLKQDSDWNINLSGSFSAGAGFITGTFGDAIKDSKNILISAKAKNTNALIRAMDSQGNVSVVTRTSVTTMSGQPVPVQVSNTRGYISSIEAEVGEFGKTNYTMEQSTINSGFSINVLPKVMDDGKILLQYSMNISTLAGKTDGFDERTLGEQIIQLPNVDQRSFIQQGVINNGDTLVLAGYEKANNSSTDSGVGSPNFKLPNGGRVANRSREVMVICITPVVLDHSADTVVSN